MRSIHVHYVLAALPALGAGIIGGGAENGRTQPAAPLTFTVVSAGGHHTCGVTADGAAYCWGKNAFGQLGDGTMTSRSSPVLVAGGVAFTAVSVGYDHTCGVTSAGAAYCWGFNGDGQLGDGTATLGRLNPVRVRGGVDFATVSAGTHHTCGLTAAGAAYCWGYNGEGQLGDGTTTQRWRPVPVAGRGALSAGSGGGGHTS